MSFRFSIRLLAVALIATALGVRTTSAQVRTPIPKVAVDSGPYGYTDADVAFLTGMIGHHAQAVIMANWAPTHGASPSIQILCKRIIAAQSGEIILMQNWLGDRHKPVPDPLAKHDMSGMSMSNMDMPGMEHDSLMPGMLSPLQMQQLDKARGIEFDRLFITYMIMHHRGALAMTEVLFNSDRAAKDEFVFKFATGVEADQSAEISRMGKMLDALPPPRKPNP